MDFDINNPPHGSWRPYPGPQTRFLSLACREALYGGAAGGGKSECLLVAAAKYIGRGYGRQYHAILLRRTLKELGRSLIQRSYDKFEPLGGVFNSNDHKWSFPEGEIIRFGHCEHLGDERQYKSDEFQFIGVDEVTEFYEQQYLYLFSRLRSSTGVPLRMRAGTNPGGPGHDWVFRRWRCWLDPDAPTKASPGQVLYIVKQRGEDLVVPKGTPGAVGRCFVPAVLSDNPSVADDGQYARNLEELDQVTREQLLNGNWLIKPAAGMYFKREWVKFVDRAPDKCERIRFWDRAATEGGGDWTVGVRMARDEDRILYIEDVKRFQKSPGGVIREIKKTAAEDGKEVAVGLSEDPGQAGKFEAEQYTKELQGYTLRFLRETGDKVTRFGPFSSQAERGRVRAVKGAWNEAYCQELEGFPDGGFDDQVDSTSGALAKLANVSPRVDAMTISRNGFVSDIGDPNAEYVRPEDSEYYTNDDDTRGFARGGF